MIPPKPPCIWRFASVVMRMVRQTRIDDALDLRMLLQKLCDGERVGAVAFHAQSQRLDAAQRQEGIERPGHAAHGVLQIGELFAQLIRAVADTAAPPIASE